MNPQQEKAIVSKIDSALAFCEGFMNELTEMKKQFAKGEGRVAKKTDNSNVDRLFAKHQAKFLRTYTRQ